MPAAAAVLGDLFRRPALIDSAVRCAQENICL
jgi:hypothetical protein